MHEGIVNQICAVVRRHASPRNVRAGQIETGRERVPFSLAITCVVAGKDPVDLEAIAQELNGEADGAEISGQINGHHYRLYVSTEDK